MTIADVTEEDFGKTVENGVVLLDFWASWCGPCRTFAPVFEAAAARHPEVTFGKIDIEKYSSLAAALDVRAVPTLMVFRDGVLLAAQIGISTGPVIDELISRVLALDVQAIQREMNERSGFAMPEAETGGR